MLMMPFLMPTATSRPLVTWPRATWSACSRRLPACRPWPTWPGCAPNTPPPCCSTPTSPSPASGRRSAGPTRTTSRAGSRPTTGSAPPPTGPASRPAPSTWRPRRPAGPRGPPKPDNPEPDNAVMATEGPASEHALRASRTYGAAADHYQRAALGFWDRFGAATVTRLRLAPGGTVLDLCCGAGASALPAARAVGPEGRVLGVDIAAPMLELARARAADEGLAN